MNRIEADEVEGKGGSKYILKKKLINDVYVYNRM